MEFARPELLWTLLLVPILAGIVAVGRRRARRALDAVTGATLREALAPGRSWRRELLHTLLPVSAVAFVVVALAGPRYGSQLVKVEREGIDLVIALDTSLSMLAEDMKPSRLERAKQEMVDLIRGLQGDRVGIVVFAGDAFAICPLTVDYDAALMFTRSIDVYTVSEPGTAIDRAIRSAVALFDEEKDRDRVVILVTDGENHEGDPEKAGEEAGRRGVRIYAIGIGNPSGELIPERGTDGSISGYKKDHRGETVLTRLDESILHSVASASGGKYLPATREGLELQVLYDAISGMQRGKISGQFVERRKDRYWVALLAAGLLLLLDLLVGTVASGAGKSRGVLHSGVRSLVLAFTASALFVSPAVTSAAAGSKVDASRVRSGNEYFKQSEYGKALTLYRGAVRDSTARDRRTGGVMYNQGNALHMLGRFPEALAAYERSWSEDTTLAGQMLYNRANTLMRAGKLEAAVQGYVQALRWLPDDEQTRHNLELALRALDEQKKQQQQKKQRQQGGDQDSERKNSPPDSTRSEAGDSSGTRRNNPSPDPDQNRREQRPDSSESLQPPDSTSAPQPGDSSQAPPLDPRNMMKLSREDAMRILQALEEQEKRLQKERRRAAFRRKSRSGKDW